MIDNGALDPVKLREHLAEYQLLSDGLGGVIERMQKVRESMDLKPNEIKLLDQAIEAASELQRASNIIAILIGQVVAPPSPDITFNREATRSLQAAAHLRDVIAKSLTGG
jgi:hypothetical protein